ncbi:MAG: peptidoglycan DD-metalloendopeptidase family protein [Gammaproteobacteria bacterium]|nr:peptidoglycan DD-metalloendopeptidase family protein [Gammaproteobacteria bacterium]
MEIIVLSKLAGSSNRVCMGRGSTLLMGVLMAVALGAAAFTGYRAGLEQAPAVAGGALYTQLRHELAEQQRTVREARLQAQRNLDALALQMGAMEARLIRLDVLGQRLVEKGQLDAGEFGFGTGSPAMGGPYAAAPDVGNTVPDFVAELEALAGMLDDREQRLGALEGLLRDRRLLERVSPTGKPVEKGWISSYFGLRNDPITGRKSRHEGLDFAGKRGSNVIAVASGVVVFSGRRSGYGRIVEIDHGNGLVTRYGHNADNLVAVGDVVAKGQPIALVGASGRATGPHVHFEVLRDDRPVNPMNFIRSGKG